MRKRFTLERMLRLLITSILYLGACTYLGLDIEILDNTVWSFIVTATIDAFLWMCWVGFSVFSLVKFCEWVDSPTEPEKKETIQEIEDMIRKHFPSLDKQANDDKK